MNLSTAKSLIADLERNPRRIELFTADLEEFVLRTMDAVYELAKRGDDDARCGWSGLSIGLGCSWNG